MSRRVVQGIALLAALWGALVLAGWRFGADYPDRSSDWVDFAIFALIVSFLLLKAWLMARRTVVWGRLGASLIAANVAFAALYLLVLAGMLWPGLGARVWWTSPAFDAPPLGWFWWDAPGWSAPAHEFTVIDALRWLLVATVAWGVVELVRTPDPEGEEEP